MDVDAELYCIDPSPNCRLFFSPQQAISKKEIAKCQTGTVYMLRSFSYDAVKDWPNEIDLMFRDGDHSFEGVSRDLMVAVCCYCGLILVHTSRSSPNKFVPDSCGPLRLISEGRG
jgi:hypothetical protein